MDDALNATVDNNYVEENNEIISEQHILAVGDSGDHGLGAGDELLLPTTGARIEVYRPLDNKYYPATDKTSLPVGGLSTFFR